MVKTVGFVSQRHWGPGDDYLAVGEIQVMAEDGFNRCDKVVVTIEHLDPEDWEAYLKTGRLP